MFFLFSKMHIFSASYRQEKQLSLDALLFLAPVTMLGHCIRHLCNHLYQNLRLDIQKFYEPLCDHKVLLPCDLLLSQRTVCSLLILSLIHI